MLMFITAIVAFAATVKDSYDQIEAIISAPDAVPPDTDFKVFVKGEIIDGGSFDIFAYSFYEDADWYYDADHLVVVTSGTLIDTKGFNFGAEYINAYTLNKPAGTYKYTFIFGHRTSPHHTYDLAVEVNVEVGDGASPLMADGSVLSEGGGTVNFFLDAGSANAGRNYLILGGVSGTAPGTTLPGGMTVLPLNWDAFTDFVLLLTNTGLFPNFLGTLDGTGKSTAQINAPPLPPGFIDVVMYYAYTLNNPFDYASNPAEVMIVP
jgi:hypothetical protein